MTFGARLRALREARGLTLDQAAEACGLGGKQRWYLYESGRRPDPRLSTLIAICDGLGCTWDDLLADVETV